jgi:hypothetical protein
MKNTRIGKLLIGTLATLSLLIALTATTAFAQLQEVVHASIPFSFTVGEKTFPAGEYTFKTITENSQYRELLIKSKDGRENLIVWVSMLESKGKDARVRINFNQYGNQFFLSSISNAASDFELRLHKSKAEKSLLQTATNRVGVWILAD